jgi:hypothetical protein
MLNFERVLTNSESLHTLSFVMNHSLLTERGEFKEVLPSYESYKALKIDAWGF